MKSGKLGQPVQSPAVRMCSITFDSRRLVLAAVAGLKHYREPRTSPLVLNTTTLTKPHPFLIPQPPSSFARKHLKVPALILAIARPSAFQFPTRAQVKKITNAPQRSLIRHHPYAASQHQSPVVMAQPSNAAAGPSFSDEVIDLTGDNSEDDGCKL